jgi:hypothetical protein
MYLTKLCLRIMLGSLGLAAVAGIGLVLFSQSEIVMHVLFTLLATTVAAALLWPVSVWVYHFDARPAGLVGMGLILLDYFILVVLIWGGWFFRYSGFYVESALWATFGFVFLTGVPAVILLRFLHVAEGYLAARVGPGICALAFCELMIGTWVDNLFQGRFYQVSRFIDAGGVTGLFGVLALACMVGRPSERTWRWAGVLTAALGWAVVTFHLFFSTGGNKLGETANILLISFTVVVAHANLCLRAPLRPEHEWVRLGTLGAFLVTTGLIDLLTIGDILHSGMYLWDVGGRFAMAGGIIAGAGTLAIVVLTRFHHIQVVEEAHGEFAYTTLALVCPGCKELQTVAVGESTCATCGLRFHISLEAPAANRPYPPQADSPSDFPDEKLARAADQAHFYRARKDQE